MRLLRLVSIFGVFLISAASIAAQDIDGRSVNSNFTGHWVSESVKVFSDIGPRNMPGLDLKIDLVIDQSSNELKVKESTDSSRGMYSRDLVYFLDGRGESNKGFTAGFEYESKTVLKAQKLLIKGTVNFPGSKNNKALSEEWELSKDGKTLTIKTETSGGSSTIRHEKIFRLVP
jgi:hypothetical protein